MPFEIGKAIALEKQQRAERATWSAGQWERHVEAQRLENMADTWDLVQRCMDNRDAYWREQKRAKTRASAHPGLLTVNEFADRLGIHHQTARNL